MYQDEKGSEEYVPDVLSGALGTYDIVNYSSPCFVCEAVPSNAALSILSRRSQRRSDFRANEFCNRIQYDAKCRIPSSKTTHNLESMLHTGPLRAVGLGHSKFQRQCCPILGWGRACWQSVQRRLPTPSPFRPPRVHGAAAAWRAELRQGTKVTPVF